MDYPLLLENIKTIIDSAQIELISSLKENLENLYWEIGFELSYLDSSEIKKSIQKLSKDLNITEDIFIISYDYYRNHPVHSLRRAE